MTMTFSRIVCSGLVLSATLCGMPLSTAVCHSGIADQDDPAASKPRVLSPAGAQASLHSINEDYARQFSTLNGNDWIGSDNWLPASHPKRLAKPMNSCSAWQSPTTCSARRNPPHIVP